ncbi:MAG: alpha/beta hydrolase [bacterium]|nr:MAG: alpha/beta hydrolase [bacterium]
MPRIPGIKATRRLRRVLVALIGLCVLVGAVYITGEWLRCWDYRDKFPMMRGILTAVHVGDDQQRNGHLFQSVELRTDRGITVSACLKVPAGTDERYPAMVILGGLRTGRRTIDYLDGTDKLIFLTLDYPYYGKKEGLGILEFVASVPRIRRAMLETVPVIMLGVDYLLSRDDVLPDRIVLIGGSLGAIFVPAAMAADGRIAAGAMLFGAGNIGQLVRSNIDAPAVVAVPAGWVCAVLAAPVEPLTYVADISPRPLFMLNGLDDPRIPFRCCRILHETAQAPKTIKWIETGHLNVRSKRFHEMVSRELTEWLVSQGLVETTLTGKANRTPK